MLQIREIIEDNFNILFQRANRQYNSLWLFIRVMWRALSAGPLLVTLTYILQQV
jgi:hypothetical protein